MEVSEARRLRALEEECGRLKRVVADQAVQIQTLYITPGSPSENGHIESFHDKLRDECLDRELFYSVGEAHMLLCDWQDFYNHRRPHGSLKMLPPAVAAQREQAALEAVPAGVNPNNN